MKTIQIFTISVLLVLSFSSNATLEINVISIVKPTCNGLDNGSIEVEVSGGVEPYAYNWNTFPNQYTTQATHLKSGAYFIEVTDAQGQVAFRSVYVEEPNTSSLSTVGQQMEDVNLTASVSGSNAPYSYSLNGKPIISMEEDAVQNLGVGIHQLVVTDANNCQMVQFIQVFEVDAQGEKIEHDRYNEMISSEGDKVIRASKLIPSDSGKSKKILLTPSK